MSTFRSDLQELINHHSIESGSNTPDHILAEYLWRSLEVFDATISERDKWYAIETHACGEGCPPDHPDHIVLPRASGLDEFSALGQATRDGEVLRAAVADGVLPPVVTERCPGSGQGYFLFGAAIKASSIIRCVVCNNTTITVFLGDHGLVVNEHDRTVS